MSSESRPPKVQNALEKLGGGLAGTGVGIATGDPISATIAGRLATEALTNAGDRWRDTTHRQQRREWRVDTTLTMGDVYLRQAIDAGRELAPGSRFFELDDSGRSHAEEVIEGVLLAAEQEYEEQKIRHYGALLANLAIGRRPKDECLRLLRLARRLSYTHYVALAQAAGDKLAPRDGLSRTERLSWDGLLEELQSPYQLVYAVAGSYKLTELGETLHSVLVLSEIRTTVEGMP